jgi:hypothetical protein
MNFLDKHTKAQSLSILRDIASLCCDLGGPQSKAIYRFVEEQNYQGLLDARIDYSDTASVPDVIYARQIQALYSKYEPLELPGVDRAENTIQTFAQAESKCRETNCTFMYIDRKPNYLDSSTHAILHGAARKISRILGTVPPLDRFKPSFGPGANTSVNAMRANPRFKLGSVLECSHQLMPTISEHLSNVPAWTALHATSESDDSWIVPVRRSYGKLQLVPKNAKMMRTIVIEPLLNGFLQKGVGSYIRNRLLRVASIDLRDQSRNQSLAAVGSLDDSLATIDLSSASDTIATELVRHLLPPDWFDLLDSLRTRDVKIPDEYAHNLWSHLTWDPVPPYPFSDDSSIYRMEKFSGMGCAFTFELESLIFYALAHSVVRSLHLSTRDVSVYGDDIIIPAAAYSKLEAVLTVCGFSVNSDKSFRSGNFRESCGADFFSGHNVRPFYQKDLVSGQTLFTMHNFFIRNGEYELAARVRSICDPSYIIYGPDGFGDGHLIGSHELRRNRKMKRDGWEGGYFDTYVLRQARDFRVSPGDAVLPVYSVYTRSGECSPTDPDVVRGSRGYAKVSVYTLGYSIFSR